MKKAIIMGVMSLLLICPLFAYAQVSPVISVSVSADELILDGVPSGFDAKSFALRIKKNIKSNLEDKTYTINNEKYDYSAEVEVDSVAHKLRPFHFKAQYRVEYSYKIMDANKKIIYKAKSHRINEDVADVAGEIAYDVMYYIWTYAPLPGQ